MQLGEGLPWELEVDPGEINGPLVLDGCRCSPPACSNACHTGRTGRHGAVTFNEAAAAALRSGVIPGPPPDGRPQYREEPVKSVRVFRLDVSPKDKRRGHRARPWERVLQLTEIVLSFRGIDPRTGRQFGARY